MFGMGMQEILLILVVGVLVIGPKQLPMVARNLGKMFTQLKRATNDLREAVNREIEEHEELNEIQSFKSDIESEMNEFQSTARNYLDTEIELDDTENDMAGQTAKKSGQKKTTGQKTTAKKTTAKKTAATKSPAKKMKKEPTVNKPGSEFPIQDEMIASVAQENTSAAEKKTIKPKTLKKPRTPKKKTGTA